MWAESRGNWAHPRWQSAVPEIIIGLFSFAEEMKKFLDVHAIEE
jgi:hypothetical protein